MRALLHDVARMQELALGQLGDVDQALQPFLDAGERAEVHYVGDGAFDHLPNRVALVYRSPGIGLEPLEAERDAPLLRIDGHDVDLDLLPAVQNITRVPDPSP